MRRAARAGDCARSAPSAAVDRVDVREALITKIIDLVTADGVSSLRRHGANDVARAKRVALGKT